MYSTLKCLNEQGKPICPPKNEKHKIYCDVRSGSCYSATADGKPWGFDKKFLKEIPISERANFIYNEQEHLFGPRKEVERHIKVINKQQNQHKGEIYSESQLSKLTVTELHSLILIRNLKILKKLPGEDTKSQYIRTILYYQKQYIKSKSKTIKRSKKSKSKTIKRSIKKSKSKTIKRSIKKSKSKTIKRSIKRSKSKTIKRSIKKSKSKTIKRSKRSKSKTIKRSIKRSKSKTIKRSKRSKSKTIKRSKRSKSKSKSKIVKRRLTRRNKIRPYTVGHKQRSRITQRRSSRRSAKASYNLENTALTYEPEKLVKKEIIDTSNNNMYYIPILLQRYKNQISELLEN